MKRTPLCLYHAVRNYRTHAAGWWIVRAGSNGKIREWIAGPYKTPDEARAALARQR